MDKSCSLKRAHRCDVRVGCDAEYSRKPERPERPARGGIDRLGGKPAPLAALRDGEADLHIVAQRAESDMADQRAVGAMFDRENVRTLLRVPRVRIVADERFEHRAGMSTIPVHLTRKPGTTRLLVAQRVEGYRVLQSEAPKHE